MARRPRVTCLRCEREIASTISGQPLRHLDPATGNWCSGKPKRHQELVLELLDTVREERQIHHEVINAYLAFGDVLVDASARVTAVSEHSAALIRRVTEAIKREIAEISTATP